MEEAPKSSPWGKVDHVYPIGEGMWFVSTAGHGGIKVSKELNKQIPEYMRKGSFSGQGEKGWYEEDVDWSIVATVFPDRFKHEERQAAERTLLNWKPDLYEKFYKLKLEEGASYMRDDALFDERHANDLVVRSAWGDWHPKVPKGMVAVWATRGGRQDADGGYFLVPSEKYGRTRHFIVDPSKHQQIFDFE